MRYLFVLYILYIASEPYANALQIPFFARKGLHLNDNLLYELAITLHILKKVHNIHALGTVSKEKY